MNPTVYENIEKLSYGELIQAISKIKEKLEQTNNIDIPDNSYYLALITELDKRTKEK